MLVGGMFLTIAAAALGEFRNFHPGAVSSTAWLALLYLTVAGSIIGTFDGWRGHIYRLAVHPDFRRRGIARVLVRAVEERLIAAGARRLIPLVEKDHAWATAFWQSVGYAPDPRIVRYLRNV